MDHDEARELLEIAAVEPDGYARLAAGDTQESAALATHLAGCPDCAAEFEQLARLANDLRAVVRSMPPPELRERTLALVASTGRPRGAVAGSADATAAAGVGTPAPARAAAPGPAAATSAAATTSAARGRERPRWDRRPWLALAAVIVIAVVAAGGWWRTASDLGSSESIAAALEDVTAAAIEVAAAPDARSVGLRPAGDPMAEPDASGRLVYSPSDGELVVIAEGLTPLEAGWTYRCWVEDAAGRRTLGTMEIAGDIAYWAGWSNEMSGAAADATFGVSLALVGASTGQSVLEGQ